ncbi:leucyl aminopeptidase [Microbacteriaceae bacterium SG_E_30_P1]|uniref:Probable cytosol aminopeptidase n=1 Tax=Antiquaquibacter oligotrophicus TaxID=2880260 RepID=A0ABT6KPH5_9MICO|nr:leucyl aminopeptidase [Antiquaquibacter oligotrophicus]MDH6181052.1 leucyl aminopeptidase [Antiquaquibacter oligotrophicus]UDF13250.1 leucyl aminopeptidase [Antiquaquibacter oligotrophicus]
MTVPALSLTSESPLSIEGDVLVLGVRKTEEGPELLGNFPELATLALALDSIGVTGALDEVRRIPSDVAATESLALVGVGSGAVTVDDLRYAAGSATRQLRGIESIVFGLPSESPEETLAILEGAALGAYSFTEYRSASLQGTKEPASSIVVAAAGDDELAERAHIIATAVHTVRDLVNTPASDLYPETLADRARVLATDAGLSVDILDDDALAAGGFGGLVGVGQGSSRGPRLVKITYSPAGATTHLALVGKGITFDTGGLSLKPPTSMIGMKYDMTGAATVLAVTIAAAALKAPIQITAWMCLAENMPSGTATRPGDVIRIRGGKTVEVLNTDAEGRLVLADGLVAASEEEPDAIIDVATLTGAASVALGNRYVGTMGDTDLVTQVVDAGTRVGETLWPMPIPSEVRPLLNSDIADIANIKPGNTAGGMLIAAAFLRDFVGSSGPEDNRRTIPWAHLDIAGPANNGAAGWGFTGKGPTGVAVRALIELAESLTAR